MQIVVVDIEIIISFTTKLQWFCVVSLIIKEPIDDKRTHKTDLTTATNNRPKKEKAQNSRTIRCSFSLFSVKNPQKSKSNINLNCNYKPNPNTKENHMPSESSKYQFTN